jgi:hypothetical protein
LAQFILTIGLINVENTDLHCFFLGVDYFTDKQLIHETLQALAVCHDFDDFNDNNRPGKSLLSRP